MPITTYLEAIRQGLREEMQRDHNVFLIGEDIGVYGGAFKVTKGLFEEFGAARVIDTPISEAAIVGAAVGTAVRGLRPVAEMQFSDFITDGFNQTVNIAATTYYRWQIPVPMVIRMPSGAGISGGPWHSRNPEAWFAHQPGLKIVCPATAYDAKGLIKSAIRDNNPVLYFEHKNLYRKIKDDVPAEEYLVPVGKARIAREGRDATAIVYGAVVHLALEAAEKIFAETGKSVEVIDLRSLVPLDTEAVLSSIKKTGRVLIAHEDNLTAGFGAEIAAQIADAAFAYLDAPIKRVAAKDIPVPFALELEKFTLPSSADVEKALRELLAY
jgi:2-oxoisovalerate dehydrogenase E1 component beta subunit